MLLSATKSIRITFAAPQVLMVRRAHGLNPWSPMRLVRESDLPPLELDIFAYRSSLPHALRRDGHLPAAPLWP